MTPFFRKLQESEHQPEQRLTQGRQDPELGIQQPINQDIQIGEVRATFGSVDQDDQIHRLRFMQDREAKHYHSDSQEEDWEEPQSPLNFIILASLLIVLVVLGWFGYRWFTHSYNDVPPVLMADESPYKIRPENPGGLAIPHQDKLIYGRITPQNQYTPERLLPQPEQPVFLERQEYSQQNYAAQNQGYVRQDPNYPVGAPHFQNQAPQVPYGNYEPQGMQPMQQGQPVFVPQAVQNPNYPPQQEQQFQQPSGGYISQNHPVYQASPQQYQQYQQPAPYYQGQDPHYMNNPGSQQQGQPYPDSSYNHQRAMPQQQQLPVAAPQQMNEMPGEVGNAKHRTAELSNSGDALDKLVASEANTIEKIGSTKLKLASLNNDSPFSSPQANKSSTPKEVSKALLADGSYRVQLGSFSTEADAKKEVRRLKSLDNMIFSGKKFIIQKTVSSSTGNVIYKVMVGFFPTVNAATTFKNKMKIHRINGIIIKSPS